MLPPIDVHRLTHALPTTQGWGAPVHLDEVGSTNTEAQARGHLWTPVLAEVQTAGRGRLGRSWQEVPGAGLALSVVVPGVPSAGWLPLAAGVAVHRALADFGVDADLKWPNDVLLPDDGERKVCGVLCQMPPGGNGVVVGIGINVHHTREQLPVPTATSLRLAGSQVDRTDLAVAVLRHLRPGQADVIVANDLDAVPIALWLRPRAGVHADLHEYFPRLHEEHDAWMRRISPYQAWLCRRFLPGCAAITTVSARIAAEYADQFGLDVGVVTNATPYAELSPRPVGSPLRLVHSGACLRNRSLHVMVDAVVAAAGDGSDVTLDLYLTPNDPPYLAELKDRAEFTAGIVRVHDPVPYASLLATLHQYDLGMHVLPPVSFNNANALPNKIFDYVQARIGLLVGPSPEMARLVREHGLGLVAAGFDMQSVATAVSQLDVEQVTAFKKASDAAAHELSDAEQSRRWVESVRAIAAEVHG